MTMMQHFLIEEILGTLPDPETPNRKMNEATTSDNDKSSDASCAFYSVVLTLLFCLFSI